MKPELVHSLVNISLYSVLGYSLNTFGIHGPENCPVCIAKKAIGEKE